MKIRVVSIKAHPYAGKTRPPGTEYELTGESEFRLFSGLGCVERAKSPAPAPVAPPVPAEAPAAPASPPQAFASETGRERGRRAHDAEDAEAPKPASKRSYRRRDLTAEK